MRSARHPGRDGVTHSVSGAAAISWVSSHARAPSANAGGLVPIPSRVADASVSPERETCKAMKGLVSEGSQMIDAKGDPAVRDAALIAAAQRVEHYEMAGYGSARTFAEQLGMTQAADLLQTTLDEEGAADKKLTQLATQTVNQEALRGASARAAR